MRASYLLMFYKEQTLNRHLPAIHSGVRRLLSFLKQVEIESMGNIAINNRENAT